MVEGLSKLLLIQDSSDKSCAPGGAKNQTRVASWLLGL